MRKLIVSEWMSLDGVFDAEKMGQWFEPYHSDSRAEHIQGNILGSAIQCLADLAGQRVRGEGLG